MTCEQCGGKGYCDVDLVGVGMQRINCPKGCEVREYVTISMKEVEDWVNMGTTNIMRMPRLL